MLLDFRMDRVIGGEVNVIKILGGMGVVGDREVLLVSGWTGVVGGGGRREMLLVSG